MGDIFYVIKMLIITALVCLFMQIRLGEYTLEDRAMNWVRSSSYIEILQEVADGAIVFGRELYKKVTSGVNTPFWDHISAADQPGHRTLSIGIERSQEYLKAQAQRAKKAVGSAVNDLQDAPQSRAIRDYGAENTEGW